MTRSVERWLALGVHPPLDVLRRRKLEATQALLGDTITFSDTSWHEPSLLPGWSRAHVATHLARNADAMTEVWGRVFTSPPMPPRATRAERRAAIEQGARRNGLDLQIDLDTSAGRLSAACDAIEDSGTQLPVALNERLVVPAPIAALARLSEVVLHHVDMGVAPSADTGVDHESSSTFPTMDAETARWLAAWELFRGQGDNRLPAMRVLTHSGLEATVGPLGAAPELEVSGSDADLVRWLSGRGDAAGLLSSGTAPAILPPH